MNILRMHYKYVKHTIAFAQIPDSVVHFAQIQRTLSISNLFYHKIPITIYTSSAYDKPCVR